MTKKVLEFDEFWKWGQLHYMMLVPPPEESSPNMKKAKTETRSAILDAAEAIVRRDGVARLTLDAVVKESGISKGGILYHFAGKQALVQGMLARLFHDFQTQIAAFMASEPAGPGRWLRAYVKSTFQGLSDKHDLTSALIAALATDTELLTPLEKELSQWQEQGLNDGVPPEVAMLIMLAADGLWLSSIFNSQPLDVRLKAQVLNQLLAMAQPSSAPQTKV